jgi:hypothetical protein
MIFNDDFRMIQLGDKLVPKERVMSRTWLRMWHLKHQENREEGLGGPGEGQQGLTGRNGLLDEVITRSAHLLMSSNSWEGIDRVCLWTIIVIRILCPLSLYFLLKTFSHPDPLAVKLGCNLKFVCYIER